MDQKKLIITSVIVYLIAATGAYLGTTAIASSSTKKVSTNQTVEPTISSEPLTEECPINGQMFGKSAKAKWEKRRPLAVVIENHAEARPQSGISNADVVYEAVSEGGVTRTLDIYYCQDAKTIGPVRSARVHFINLLREWGNNPLYAHVGGANCDETTGSGCGNGAPADALGYLRDIEWNFYNDLNQFSIPYPYFYRDYDRLPGVATEHTMYSSTAKLWDYAAKNRKLTNVDEDGVAWDEDWKPWTFVDEAKANARGKESPIAYNFYDTNVGEYGVRWEYDPVNNVYNRFHGTKAHLDFDTNNQLTAKNVIVIEARESSANDDYPGGHIVYKLTGSGTMYAFQNGKAIEGTWEKEELDSKMIFLDSAGKEIPIVRGNVWISMIPEGNEVLYGSKAKVTETKQTTTKSAPKSAVSE
jgi:hypothetical protein